MVECRPLTAFDTALPASVGLTVGYILDASVANRLVEVDAAAGRVVQRWKALGSAVQRDKKTGQWSLQVPTSSPPSSTRHRFTTSSSSSPLQNTPFQSSHSFIQPRPPLSLFRHPSTNYSLASLVSSRDPLLAIHCTTLPDAVCLGITVPHGVFDATGLGFIIHALDAELAGREWSVPSGASPTPRSTTSEAGETYSDLLRCLRTSTVWGWISLIVSMLWEFVWGGARVREVFLKQEDVDKIVRRVKVEVEKESDGTEWVSTGDVMVAWILKTVYSRASDASSSSRIALSSIFSSRTIIPELATYPHNAGAQFSLPSLTLYSIAAMPLATLALLHRRTLTSARTIGYHDAFATTLLFPSIMPRRTLGEPHWVFSNQALARLADFEALGPLRGFWMDVPPILSDHFVMINRVKEGYVIVSALRRNEWEAIQKALDELED